MACLPQEAKGGDGMKTKKLVCYNCGGHGFITATYESGQTSAICPVCGGIGTHEIQMTNADRIRAMSDEELAEFIQNMVDGSNSHNVACYGCINYGTHHSDPANKGTCLYECDGCENEGIGLDVLKWLQRPAEGDGNA